MQLDVICDFPEEGWTSMDLCAEMLLRQIRESCDRDIRASKICPRYWRVAGYAGWGRFVNNADRLLNRWWTYPRHLKSRATPSGLVHVCDHSYAHLVHQLPADRTGVYCHDLDAFACLLNGSTPRPQWFRHLSQRILQGMQRAAVVFCNTKETGRQLVRHKLIPESRIVHAPLGVAFEFTPAAEDLDSTELLHPALAQKPYLLHVGSCIPRKRIDVLLKTFAAVRQNTDVALVQIGGAWSPSQFEQIEHSGFAGDVIQLRNLSRESIAVLYRDAAVVLQPSEAEGFGLPVIEALACGNRVIASDIPVLREVGGKAVLYCPVGDVDAWADTTKHILANPAAAPAMSDRLAQASGYTWARHAEIIVTTYRKIAGRAPARSQLSEPRLARSA